jgi:hypothetical protein
MTNKYTVLFGKSEGKKPYGRPGSRWKDNIKMDVKEIEYEDMDLII